MGVLNEKIAIVTGASDGIGRAIAERLAQEGATVVVNYGKSADKAKEVVAGIEAKGGKAVAIQADMSKVADVGRLVKDTVKNFGRLDILVNNAGMFMYKPLAETTEEEFDRMFALNTKGPYFALTGSGEGHQGRRAYREHFHGRHPYRVWPALRRTSGARGRWSSSRKAWHMNWHPRGITVNTVSPGYTVTAMIPADSAFRQIGEQASPLKRLGTPKDIADVVAFVVSEDARWLTGQNLHAGGGVVM